MLSFQDKFIVACVSFALATCTVFAFVFGSRANAVGLLSALGGVVSILVGCFHWLYIHDSKTKDAC